MVNQGWFYAQKFGEGSWVEARKLTFFISHGTNRLGTVMGTRQAIGTHTGGQCEDAVETGIDADRPAHTTHGCGKRGSSVHKNRNGAAYVMHDWAGRMASILI